MLSEAQPLVGRRRLAALGRPAVELRQQHAQRRGLHLVEARVVTDLDEGLLVLRPVEAQGARVLGHLVVVGRDRAAVAQAGQVLGGKKEKVAAWPSAPALMPSKIGARCLGGVLEHGRPELSQLATGARLPNRCTGTIALVRGVSAALTRLGASRRSVSRSMSQKTGVAPATIAASAVA